MNGSTLRAVTSLFLLRWGAGLDGGSANTSLLAQAATLDCRPGEPSAVCCIKKHPHDPVGACGATSSEVEQVLGVVRPEVSAGENEDDFANNASLPEWKQRCIRNYNNCRNEAWTGPCDDCLRYCEGQQGDWPFNKCVRRKRD